jgi:predicted ATPase
LFLLSVQNETLKFSLEEGDNPSEVIRKDFAIPQKTEELLNYSKNHLHYLSAHRLGNQDLHVRNNDKYDLFGIYGEYVIDYFQHHKTEPLIEKLIKSPVSNTLETQVNYWLNRILHHSLRTEVVDGTDKIKAEFTHFADRNIRSKNTGSGVSYIISIIISCLSSQPGDVIIIENPEIHLHPQAQSLMTDFFVFIANAGIQLIIETHSDHIFNGVRVQIFRKNIKKEDVNVHFFNMDYETKLSKHTKVIINEQGRIENQKDLLFDQFDNDINSLLGL